MSLSILSGPWFSLDLETSAAVDNARSVQAVIAGAESILGWHFRRIGYQGKNNRYNEHDLDSTDLAKFFAQATEYDQITAGGACAIEAPAAKGESRIELSWQRIREGSFDAVVRQHGYPQNRVTISFPVGRLAEEGFTPRLIQQSIQLADTLKVNYGRGFCPQHEVARPDVGARGISGGLPDVYWMNILGTPFTELIGYTRLRGLGAVFSSSSRCVLLAREEYGESDLRGLGIARRELRSAIGEDYFRRAALPPTQSGHTGGMLRFLMSAWFEKRSFQADDGAARVSPKIEWSDFFSSPPTQPPK